MICRDCQTALPDLLFDPAAASSEEVRRHLESCSACRQEFESVQATFALLDSWTAPEPSPYFDQKLAVRLREEQAMPPAGWLERLRSRVLFNTGRQFRPALAGALALVLLLAGGTFADLSEVSYFGSQPKVSATVNDLQLLNKNDQALQTMGMLLQDDGSNDSSAPAPDSSL